ncbi:uncharacterized protein [Anoplolepis gracilipes]|uniref:uncharacterized protein n=1 Tax=Anoplolepis gracilipes TaxID=354296 RepID=UPI003BA098F6
MCISYVPDKMAISYSNHLFVPVVFVFCLLSPLVQTEDLDDYTDSRQLEKNLAVSRERNNIQWFPNYNWKPPQHYGLRKESTEEKAGMKFTKPEDLEQRIADPWIKKMQEISRQKREKWVPYKRNENEKLALDNVEETTRANKLTNDESITIPTFSAENAEYDKNVKRAAGSRMNLFKGSKLSQVNVEELNPTILMTLAQPLIDQDDVNVKDLDNVEIIQEASAVPHRRHKDYEISDIKEDVFDKQSTDYKKSELEEDRSLISKVNSHSKESISQDSTTQHGSNSTRRNINKVYSNSSENLNYKDNSKESSAKEYPKQPNPSQNDKEETSNDSKKYDDKIVTTKPLTRKNKKETDDAREDTTGRPLNHGGSFHSGRWGMNVLSPPTEFLKDIFRQSMRRKNGEHTESEKDGRHDLVGRWGMSVTSRPKEFHKNTLMQRTSGTEPLTVKPESRPSQIKRTSERRSLIDQSYYNSQADPTQQLIIDERNKEPADTLYEKVPNNFYHFQNPKLNYWNKYQTNVDLNNHLFLKNLKFLIQALQSYVEQNDVDIPMSCRIQIPHILFRI